MRSMLWLGVVVASAAGCKNTHSTVQCTPCNTSLKAMSCPVPPGAPAPGKPGVLPPTIHEVRGNDDAEPRSLTATPPQANPDVLLVPRWVYVPYSPHAPNGPTKLPANLTGAPATGPFVQADDQVTVLPPVGAPAASGNEQLLEQCLQQMKLLNQRMSELEAKGATRPAGATAPAAPITPPQILPLPPLPVPLIPPAK